jgi:D-lyxose ketol-isomerase
MKRSQINAAIRSASACFGRNGWALPPSPRWDVTDFGLGDFSKTGLVLINLAEEKEYCEKLMYARQGQSTPMHCHRAKKEDIIARSGALLIQVWPGRPGESARGKKFEMKRNGAAVRVAAGETLRLAAGERVTLEPGVYHEFHPETDECVIGEVSTANDDAHDNVFIDPSVGRFPETEEDEPAAVRLVGDR